MSKRLFLYTIAIVYKGIFCFGTWRHLLVNDKHCIQLTQRTALACNQPACVGMEVSIAKTLLAGRKVIRVVGFYWLCILFDTVHSSVLSRPGSHRLERVPIHVDAFQATVPRAFSCASARAACVKQVLGPGAYACSMHS